MSGRDPSPPDTGDDGLAFEEAHLAESVPARFERVCRVVPHDHPAYVERDGSMTYGRLDEQSDRLAAALVTMLDAGAYPDGQKAVALLLPHTAAELVGIMGTLKAGHFYIPLDLDSPASTLRQILSDCPPQAIVTTADRREQVGDLLNTPDTAPILAVDDLPPLSGAAAAIPAIPPQAFACVQYTSGSTGVPRGVIRTHAMKLHSSYLTFHENGYRPGERVAHLLPYAHAFSTTTLFGGILSGATLYSHPIKGMSPAALYDWLQVCQITRLNAPIATLRGLSALADSRPVLAALRGISTGGAIMERPEVEQLCRLLPTGCRLVFRLASTEAGTYARFVVEVGKPWSGDRTPGGYSPPHTQVIILDDAHRPLPCDTEGEIAVRSRYVCAGYWNRPEETAAKFLPDPGGTDERVFLTGDLGRMSADGLVEHLGRLDLMVKIRGHRVQLEEVEGAIKSLATVKDAAVVAQDLASGEKRLVAYVVPVAQPPPTASAMRSALLEQLPAYKVPSAFAFLETPLPVTSTGKLDRQALPAPGAARPRLDTPYVTPRGELETQLAALWAEVLELDEVGVDDDFFELGGDSLSILSMTLLVEQALGWSVPAQAFRHLTIRSLIRLMTGQPDEEAHPSEHARPDEEQPAVTNTQPGSATSGWRAFSGGRVRRVVIRHGPAFRNLALPYALGTRLQRAWLGRRIVQDRLFAEQCRLFRLCLADAGLDDPDGGYLTLNLMANTWSAWRNRILGSPSGFARWVTTTGTDPLQSAGRDGEGIIIVFVHQTLSVMLTKKLLGDYGIREVLVLAGHRQGSDSSPAPVRRAMNVVEGAELLRRGGAVLIAGEGRASTNPVPIAFHRRRLPIPAGFAELALHSQASVATVFAEMWLDGQVTLEFARLPTPATQAEATEVLHQYCDMLVARWPRLLPTTVWPRLQYLQTLPRV